MASIKLTNQEIWALIWAIEITKDTLAGNDELDNYELKDLERLAAIKDKLENA